MEKLKQFAELKIESLAMISTRDLHIHEYYEFVLIRSGHGKHHVHDTTVDFCPGDVFYLNPGSAHFFEILSPAEATVIRYSEHIRSILKTLISNWDGYAVPLSRAKSPLNPKVTLSKADQPIAIDIFNLILRLSDRMYQNENLIFQQMISLVSIIERNLSFAEQQNPVEKLQDHNIQKIMRHIHKNMKNPVMLSHRFLAETFNIPVSYIGVYFKRNTGQTLKDYILECRMKIISRKLKNTSKSISEIGFEFGYTDESHFYKSFKQFCGQSPSDFRKSKGARN